MGWFGRLAIGLAAVASMTAEAEARITHLEITTTEAAFGGQSFGETGAYEHLTGRVTGELDPADPANSGVQDINLAPRNARGMVEYVTNVELLKPADTARGNRILFFEVNNRGNKLALSSFNAGVMGGVADRNALSSPGDGWLMRRGYTMVWFGWEMDLRPGMSRVGMPAIVAHNHDGSPITGIVRSEIITPVPAASLPISLSQQIQNYPIDSYDSYPTASADNSAPFADGFLPTLTVRAREQDPREPIPNSAWSFGICDQSGAVTPDEKHLCYRDGFKPGHLYELIYRAKDPTVGGLRICRRARSWRLPAQFRQRRFGNRQSGFSDRQSRHHRRQFAERTDDPQPSRAWLQPRRGRAPRIRWRLSAHWRGPHAAQRSVWPAGAGLGRADRPSLPGLRFPVHLCAPD
jgi:hypothetical protein